MTPAYSYNLNGLIGFVAINLGWPLVLFVITRPAFPWLRRRHR